MCPMCRLSHKAPWGVGLLAAVAFPSHAQRALPLIDIRASGVERFEPPTVVTKRTEEKTVQTLGGSSNLHTISKQRSKLRTDGEVFIERQVRGEMNGRKTRLA